MGVFVGRIVVFPIPEKDVSAIPIRTCVDIPTE